MKRCNLTPLQWYMYHNVLHPLAKCYTIDPNVNDSSNSLYVLWFSSSFHKFVYTTGTCTVHVLVYILPYMDNPTSFVDEWTILTIGTAALTSITLRMSSFVSDGGEELTTSLSRMSTLKATIVVCRFLT